MKTFVLSTAETSQWCGILSRLEADVYFLPQYHRAHERNGDGQALAFVAEDGERTLFYPFLLRPIERVGGRRFEETHYDIETVYGYSGPLSNTTDKDFLGSAWAEFRAWCRRNLVVAEFIRFHPLLNNHHLMDESCRVQCNRQIVAVDLALGESGLWSECAAAHRRAVRRARRAGASFKEFSLADGLPVFQPLYECSMDRLQAGGYYRFSQPFFEAMVAGLGEQARIFAVFYGDTPAAAALVLLDGDRIHYHLEGSDVAFWAERPNNYLIYELALWGMQHGFRWLNLGGGRTTRPDDTLLRFKGGISKLRLPFHVGTRIHDECAYHRLRDLWMGQNCHTPPPDYFLLYRLEQAS